MSRTYKLAIYGQKVDKKDKRSASKAVRRYTDCLSDGGLYKKVYNSWDIRDYLFDCSHYPLEEIIWNKHKHFRKGNNRTYIWT